MNNNSDEIYLAKITQYIEWSARGQIYCIGATVIVSFVVHVQTIAIFFKKSKNLLSRKAIFLQRIHFILTYLPLQPIAFKFDKETLILTKWFLLESR